MNRISYALTALAAALILAGCGAAPQQTTPPESIALPAATHPAQTQDPNDLIQDLSIVLSEGEMYLLDQFPNLKTLDLSGSRCYEVILKYMDRHPQVAVTYTVDLGGTIVAGDSTDLTLEAGQFDYDTLMENLAYLPRLVCLTLEKPELTGSQIRQFEQRYPAIALDYTVELLGKTYGLDTQELDLRRMSASALEEVEAGVGLLTNLTDVRLGSSLTLEQVARLQDANPEATFHYTFSLYGRTLSTTDTEVVFQNYYIGSAGVEKIRQALAVLDDCQRFVLDNCRIDYPVLADLREEFRDGPRVVWRVYFGVNNRYNALTDQETIRAVYNVTDDTCGPLQYCEGAKYLDLGHNEQLTDLSWAGNMPELEVLIASGCAVKTLEGFDACKKLTWLELAYCAKLTDIEGLIGCESLAYLNLSYTGVSDYSALDGLPLQRFACLSPKASSGERSIFKQIHPDCLAVFSGHTNPYGYGWRYDDNGKTFNEYYKTVIREVFNYDELEKLLPSDT